MVIVFSLGIKFWGHPIFPLAIIVITAAIFYAINIYIYARNIFLYIYTHMHKYTNAHACAHVPTLMHMHTYSWYNPVYISNMRKEE